LTGLEITSLAPSSNISAPFVDEKAVIARTTAFGSREMISFVASIPSIPGMTMSMSTRSGCLSKNISIALRPSAASMTSVIRTGLPSLMRLVSLSASMVLRTYLTNSAGTSRSTASITYDDYRSMPVLEQPFYIARTQINRLQHSPSRRRTLAGHEVVGMVRSSIKVLVIISDNERRGRILDLMARSPMVRLEAQTSTTLEGGMAMASSGIFEAALIDLDLPDCQGLDALARFKERVPRLPLTLLTEGPDRAWMEKALQMGAQNQVVMWHFDEVSLPSFLECAMERKLVEEMNKTLKVVNSILRHDVLNHLTVIGGSLEVYKMKKDEKFLASATNAVDRSVDLIKKMKEVEMVISPKEMKMVDLRQVIDEVVRKHPGSKIGFEVEGQGEVLADDALVSVFDNIVNNAILHSGSDVVRIVISKGREEGYCEVRISDQGVGIPNEVKPKIWQEGYKYGKSGQSGLGLFIVKKVMERYGGLAYVEDNRPKGTTFVLRLRCEKAP